MGLIYTGARCRDCYRCIKTCQLKAIRMNSNGAQGRLHAQVIDELCVHCGQCILACPQQAKKPVSDLKQVQQLISQGTPVVAVVAASFVSALPLPNPDVLPTLLRELGFAEVQETSVGAGLVTKKYLELGFAQPLIVSYCPVVVNLIERHYPELIPMLAPVVSPMVAQGRIIKSLNPDASVVYIGPCAAKRDEAQLLGLNDTVDYFLGFNELWAWAQTAGIAVEKLSPGSFQSFSPCHNRIYPVEGGMIWTVADELREAGENFITMSGLDNCIEFLKHLSRQTIVNPPKLMELWACKGGCINGPLSLCLEESLFMRQRKLLEYYNSSGECDFAIDNYKLPEIDLGRSFKNRKINLPLPSEAEIKAILARTGKHTPAQEFNCGNCGYDSCRAKAVAVYQGKAAVEMCIPYMRKRAESMSNLIISAMPNAVVVVGKNLDILEINPAAEKLFQTTASQVVGQRIFALMPATNFLKVIENGEMINATGNYPELGIITQEIIFPVKGTDAVVGIFVDITSENRRKEQFELIKSQTIRQAQEVIEKQMTVAQEIAGLLGEATAETKVQLGKLIKLMRQDNL
ncbi:[Fe-Fe] hydrogenase large subunit C-terminal domain-containing protein [Desulforamulus hydrothermalis]|uniref:Putative PAS/PAC sensor protein n=1 Tax=Desulforamulus hydrothermalis Lam5 = DSM 18033 TaxID=1121428 RepID=K8EEX7_9FIRM|nr:[Fe-Fe] hydrogenase large subunit C-terminal domain-containing protein [Desulforamulus hydrothermalis]CCO07291.1 putative PAS/PAC sensor protein [Desulforamulus hydrothermalis Lam5 = DSM 18033]SHG93319.1 Iron only hydrogenase large subunit, C-terminal domain [Desulforamulus hydrothermalis Lam5 = DSM 18033]